MVNARMASASVLDTIQGQIAASVSAISLACTEPAMGAHASARPVGQELNVTQRCAPLVARSTEHASLTPAACALMDGREMIAQQRSVPVVLVESARTEYACAPMDLEEPLALSIFVVHMDAMEMESALADVASATRDSMGVTVLWSSALIAKALTVIASMDLAHARVVGLERTAKLLSVTMIALDMVSAMMEHASATLVGLDPIARQRSVRESQAAHPATRTDGATQSVSSACVLMAGLKQIAPRSLARMTVQAMACVMMAFVRALPDFLELIAPRAHA